MANLFNLPTTRSSKEADKYVVNKSTNKKSASTVIKGGGVIGKIAEIKARVESRLGKYKDDYLYIMQENKSDLIDYITACLDNGILALDTETTGLDPMQDKIVGFSLYTPGQKACYVPLNHISYITNEKVEGQLSLEECAEQLKFLSTCKIIMYNAKFDIRVLRNQLGVYLSCYFDCHLAGYCLNENEPHGLKTLHSKYVLDGKEDEWNFGKLFEDITFDKIPIKTGYIYAARDAIDTFELYEWQLPYLTPDSELCKEYDLEGPANVFWNIEMPYINVVADMEDTGISFDTEYAKELSNKYNKLLEEKLDAFNVACSKYDNKIREYRKQSTKLEDPINISSPTQLAILLYDIMLVGVVDEKKPRGTGDEILEKLDNDVSHAIQEYRTVEKLLSTYIDKLPDCINPKTGKIHCNFNQYGAKTGRMSSDNPNMQNIPSHNKDIRQMFIASPGYIMMSADFSQQEPKVMTAMCKDPEMIRAYREGKDLYASIASLAYNKPYEECLEFRPDGSTNKEGKERRASAKSILLGILYGRGINSISEQLHTTKEKAKVIQDKVFKEFPAIKKFEDDSIEHAEEYGYVTTFWGRKRRLPEMQLDAFEFKWMDGYGDLDPLSFDNNVGEIEVPDSLVKKYTTKLRGVWGTDKRKIVEDAKKERIKIIDNGGKIADATRQVVNSRIQGSAADMTKIAGAIINKNERLKELGFRLLVPIHDEYLAECPIENAKECKELFAKCMCEAAVDLNLPISVDVECSYKWYGETINL